MKKEFHEALEDLIEAYTEAGSATLEDMVAALKDAASELTADNLIEQHKEAE